jgi:hypothetical protein
MLRSLFCFFIFSWVFQCAWALESQRVFRCGSVYTNQPDPALNCKPLSAGPSLPNAAASGARVDNIEQRQRDTQAHALLQAELHKAQQQQATLRREWNGGEPERRADEFRQPQKYQDRVSQLRASLQRVDADVAGLQRELSRLSATTSNGSQP